MPVFEFEGPDGKTHTIEGPDGSTREEAFAQLQQRLNAAPANDTGQTFSAAAGLGQGATLGFGDELYGAIASVSQPITNKIGAAVHDLFNPEYAGAYAKVHEEVGPRTYEQERDFARGVNREAQEANPNTYLGGQVTGALASAIPAGAAVAPQSLRGLTMLGAAEGGVAGLGFSDAGDVVQQVLDTGKGVLSGAAFGFLFPGAARFAQNLFSKSPSAARNAGDKIMNDLADAGLDAQQAQEVLDANPDLILADVAETTQNRLAALTQQPGQTAQDAAAMLEQRNIDQLSRLTPKFASVLGESDVLVAAKTATKEASEAARPLYDIAYQTEVPAAAQTQFAKIAERPTVKAALQKARKLAADEGVELADGEVDLQTLDYVMRGLSDKEATLIRTGSNNAARVAGDLRRQVAGIADTVAPEFAQARQIHASRFADTAALEYGRKAIGMRMSELREITNDLSGSEMTHFRIGVFDDLMERMGNKSETANLVQDFKKPNFRETVRIAFGDDDAFNQFMQGLGDETTMFATMSKALRGSPTFRNQSFGGVTDAVLPMAADAVVPGAGMALQAGRSFMRGRNPQGNQAVQDQMGQMLLGRDANAVMQQATQPMPLGVPTSALASPAAIDPNETLQRLLGN